jgi:pimeloyl-ACP methyl ester carboxylesterase
VFVHGLFMSGFMWHDVIDDVKGKRRCIAYNLPVHGGSSVAPEQELTLAANARMLQAFCDELGLESFDLVANDTGGAIAQAFAVTNQARLRTLTLTNCEARDWMPSHDEMGQLVDRLARQGELAPVLAGLYADLDSARAGQFSSTLEAPERLSDDDLRGVFEPHHATLEGARQVERFAASLDAEELMAIEPQLRQLRVPTLAVWGTADQIFPLHLALWLRDTIPGLEEVVEIDGGKLFWPWERGHELTPHLLRHWSQAAAAVS